MLTSAPTSEISASSVTAPPLIPPAASWRAGGTVNGNCARRRRIVWSS